MSEQTEPLSPPLQDTADQPDLPEGWLAVQSMDLDAQGVARKPDGKVVFIDGALPFEWVSANTHRKKNNWEQASLTDIHRESSQRVRPGCPHFGLHGGACGGCKMQHLDTRAQVAVKQRALRPGRVPPRLVNAERDICCNCGQWTASGIYIREDPCLWPCDGGHVDNDHIPLPLPGQRR